MKSIDANNPHTTVNLSEADVNKEDEIFEKLFLNIKANGIKTPIKLIPLDGKTNYQVVDGLKRLAIMEQLGFDSIPAVIQGS